MNDSHCNFESWQHLAENGLKSDLQLSDLFAQDNQRFEKYSIQACDILYDYSKQKLNDTNKAHLLQLAADCRVEEWRDAMFSGEIINRTEGRAVLHSALRCKQAGDENIQQQVAEELRHIEEFSTGVRGGQIRGWTGEILTDIVCIGVGGSNLGPQMVTEALKASNKQQLAMHYISSVDAVPLLNLLSDLDPVSTLFVIASKTFTTSETMLNAHTARKWFLQSASEEAIANHFVAATAAVAKAVEFGIAKENCFQIWDWVGGRFSLWSAIGLPIALHAGFDTFQQLLEGGAAMDKHFLSASLGENMPVMMAMVGVWNSTFLGSDTLAVLPYDQNLHMLPAYLQQAEMESNGKSMKWDGEPVSYSTCPIVWGQTGINGQHAFYQLLHQGTHCVPADFIASVHSNGNETEHHETLLANYFAQTQALMNGVTEQQVKDELMSKGMSLDDIENLAAHKVHAGNRPSSSLLLDRVDAHNLGALIALYEHKIFVQGIIWQVHSFDQWGVELGKALAKNIQTHVSSGEVLSDYDGSTNGLVNYYKSRR